MAVSKLVAYHSFLSLFLPVQSGPIYQLQLRLLGMLQMKERIFVELKDDKPCLDDRRL